MLDNFVDVEHKEKNTQDTSQALLGSTYELRQLAAGDDKKGSATPAKGAGIPTGEWTWPGTAAPRPAGPATQPQRPSGPPTQPDRPVRPVQPVRPATPNDLWQPTTPPAVKPAEAVRPSVPSDLWRPGKPQEKPEDTLRLKYGDADFDKQLRSTKATKVIIDGVPQGAERRYWLNKDGFFLFFKGGTDGEAKHHFPVTVHKIEIRGVEDDADKMRAGAAMAFAKANDPNKSIDRAIDGTERLDQYGKRTSKMADGILGVLTSNLKQAADQSQNPVIHLQFANFLAARMVRPILANVDIANNTFNLNDPNLGKALEIARQEAQKASTLARKDGDFLTQNQANHLDAQLALMQIVITPDQRGGRTLKQILGLPNDFKFELLPPIQQQR